MVRYGIVLGHKISSKGIEIDPTKMDVIAKLPPPTDERGVRSFHVHVGFYRSFIKDFFKIAKLLSNLLVKDTPFVLTHLALKLLNYQYPNLLLHP